jgi:hypothetical protein
MFRRLTAVYRLRDRQLPERRCPLRDGVPLEWSIFLNHNEITRPRPRRRKVEWFDARGFCVHRIHPIDLPDRLRAGDIGKERKVWKLKKITIRKAGPVRLTSAAQVLYAPGCVVVN